MQGNVLRKTVRRSVHLLRKPLGWAWDQDILDQAEASGVQWVEVRESETGNVYRALLADFHLHGVEFNRGFGRQVVLTLPFWRVSQPGEPAAVQMMMPL